VDPASYYTATPGLPDDDHVNRSKWRRLLPHTQYALLQSPTEDDDRERLSLVRKCALTLYSEGRYKEAEELFSQAMETTKRVHGDEHPNALSSMANLAATYRN
jgi:hypothetical protein